MIEQIHQAMQNPETLDQAKDALLGLFQQLHNQDPKIQIWYVPGLIRSNGLENMAENLRVLAHFAKVVGQQMGEFAFAPTDVFDQAAFDRIDPNVDKPKNIRYMAFWRAILESGLIYGVVMTPRWKESEGAKDEYAAAQKMGMVINFISPDGIISDNDQ